MIHPSGTLFSLISSWLSAPSPACLGCRTVTG
jgi:hypothetical protein